MKGEPLTASDISEWIDNDEGLYNWQRTSGLSKRKFIQENRAELERLIKTVRDAPPREPTWRDYANNHGRPYDPNWGKEI